MSQDIRYFDPRISGLGHILNNKGLAYYERDGLNIVLHGPAGSGKTLFALQCAIGALASGRHVIYLSKDIMPETLLARVSQTFGCFGIFNEVLGDSDPPPYDSRDVFGIRKPPTSDNSAELAEYAEYIKSAEYLKYEECAKCDEKPKPWRRSEDMCPKKEKPSSQVFYAHDPYKTMGAKQEGTDFFAWRVLCMDILARRLENQDVTRERVLEIYEKTARAQLFAVGSLGLFDSGEFDRYAANNSFFDGLARLCPRLRPIFEGIHERSEKAGIRPGDFFVVCDALPETLLEDCLRAQTEAPAAKARLGSRSLSRGGAEPTMPIMLFVMENAEMPDPVTASFPPDVQIKMGSREEMYGKKIRTIQILKARFQEHHSEPFPFVITANEEESDSEQASQKGDAQLIDINIATGPGERLYDEERKKRLRGYPTIGRLHQGINIFRSLPSVVHTASPDNPADPSTSTEVTFGIDRLDALTDKKYLFGGGTTLVATENRCHSTALALHFLLGEIGKNAKDAEKARGRGENNGSQTPSSTREDKRCLPPQQSVLYIALDNDLIGVLHDIWRYPLLRRAICAGTPEPNAWDTLTAKLRNPSLLERRSGQNQLYSIPLADPFAACPVGGKQTRDVYKAFLHVLVPDLAWSTAEEVLQALRLLFDKDYHGTRKEKGCRQCLHVSRVVLNRVSRVPANWPLIQDPTLLVSNLIRLCAARQTNLMIVDDTATQSETTGHIESRWQNPARNIIRLRRVPLHGTEVVGLEIIRASGVNLREVRPQELRSICDIRGDSSEFRLDVADTFRGYTGIFSGKPQRCKTTVDLTYDIPDSPLHRDALTMKRNLEGIMENVTVNVLGPQERPGVNSALSNLADVSHDTCRVVSVDEIWLHRLIRGFEGASGLVAFSYDEQQRILPDHIKLAMTLTQNPDVGEHYVTQALMPARCKLKDAWQDTVSPSADNTLYAIPFRHNWGVLTASRFENDQQTNLTESIVGFDPKVVPEGAYNGVIPTWEELIQARTEWKCKEIPFFDFHRATEDSVVSFFLELLLSSCEIKQVFCRSLRKPSQQEQAKEEPGLLFFRTRDWNAGTEASRLSEGEFHDGRPARWLCDALKYALRLIYNLLNPEQRKEIALDKERLPSHDYRVVSKEDGALHIVQVDAPSLPPDKRPAMVTREWLTTAPRDGTVTIARQNDKGGVTAVTLVRKVVLRELPISKNVKAGNTLSDAIVHEPMSTDMTLSGAEKDELLKRCGTGGRSYGVTVSGAWYLGAMSGGNRELAADIVRELVSEYHELDRFQSGSGMPVSRRFYEDSSWLGKRDGDNTPHHVPYADLMRYLAGDPAAESCAARFQNSEVFFPFCRARIRNYTMIALVLYTLVRDTMRLSDTEVPTPPEEELTASLTKLVQMAVSRIDDIQRMSLQEGR